MLCFVYYLQSSGCPDGHPLLSELAKPFSTGVQNERVFPGPARPTVAVIGGGYGGIHLAKALDDVARVVLIEPKDAFVHNVAALRALADPS
jgi:NADPH-dependent 2,4-dienoyl-CoA reductase/sulfur reductase-like enzyme